jgi:hypothetical protein
MVPAVPQSRVTAFAAEKPPISAVITKVKNKIFFIINIPPTFERQYSRLPNFCKPLIFARYRDKK